MKRRITIKDISEMAGVSTTTVNKALSGKPKVSDEVREKIIRISTELDYRPNKTAQALARNEINIGIIYPEEPKEFFSYLKRGLEEGVDELLDYNVRGVFLQVKDLRAIDETKEALNILKKKKVDGIILTPTFDYQEYINQVKTNISEGIPTFFLLNNLVDLPGVGCAKLNGRVAGKMAAQFLDICLKERKQVIVLTANKEMSIHRECIEGFSEEAKRRFLSVKGIFEAQDDKQIAYYLTEKALKEIPNLGGIYVSSYNSVAVCKCLEDKGKTGDISVIGHDLYPELANKLENGSLAATLFQNTYEQGKNSIKKMYRHLVESGGNPGDLLMTPQLILSSNLECYRDKY